MGSTLWSGSDDMGPTLFYFFIVLTTLLEPQ